MFSKFVESPDIIYSLNALPDIKVGAITVSVSLNPSDVGGGGQSAPDIFHQEIFADLERGAKERWRGKKDI